MKSLSAKPLVAAVLAFGVLAAASAAHARSDVRGPSGSTCPSATCSRRRCMCSRSLSYVQPRPVYVQPQPVYGAAGVRGAYRGHRRGAWGDRDRDGVPNIHDRAPRNPYRY